MAREAQGQNIAGKVPEYLCVILGELADLGERALQAARTGQAREMCEASELLVAVHARFAGRYRAFLAGDTLSTVTRDRAVQEGARDSAGYQGLARAVSARAGIAVLARPGSPAAGTPGAQGLLAEAAVLLQDYPWWAIWLPADGREWTAIRMASTRPPSPGLPAVWVQAAAATELARRMRAMDEQISGGSWPTQHPAGD